MRGGKEGEGGGGRGEGGGGRGEGGGGGGGGGEGEAEGEGEGEGEGEWGHLVMYPTVYTYISMCYWKRGTCMARERNMFECIIVCIKM